MSSTLGLTKFSLRQNEKKRNRLRSNFNFPIVPILLGVVSCFDAAQVWATPRAEKKILQVGIVLRLKDTFSDTLSYTLDGIESAKILFEKTHPGFQVQLKKYTHDDSLQSVLEASNRAIADQVPAVIGGELSEESLVLRDQFGPRKIVFVTPTSSNPKVTEGFPFTFRVCFSDNWVASELAHFTVNRLQPRAVGLIHNVSSPYTDFQSKRFLEAFRQLMGGRNSQDQAPIFVEKILRDTANFNQQIKKFIQNKVTHVVLPLHRGEFLRFVTQANMMGYFPTYIGSDGWGSTEHLERDILNGSQWRSEFVAFRSTFWNETYQTSLAKAFKAEYVGRTFKLPNAWGAVAFDAAWLLFTAMSKTVHQNNGEEIRAQLAQLREVELVTHSHFTFGKDNSPESSIPIFMIQGAGTPLEVLVQ